MVNTKDSWLEANYFESSLLARKIVISIEDSVLVGKPIGGEPATLRWPVSALVQSKDDAGKIILECPPRPGKIELADDKNLASAPWRKQLPDHQHKSPIWKGIVWASICLFLGLFCLLSLPVIARNIPWSVEQRLFKSFEPYKASDYCERRSSAAREALAKLVARIYPIYPDDNSFPAEIHVVHEKEINAFAIPGGKIFVLDELIKKAESPEEIAGILAHEIEHVKQRHIMRTILERSFLALGLSIIVGEGGSADLLEFFMHAQYTKDQESAADEGALERLRDAKVSTAGIVSFFQRMEKESSAPSLLSDHPANEWRIKLFSQGAEGTFAPVLTNTEWISLEGICSGLR